MFSNSNQRRNLPGASVVVLSADRRNVLLIKRQDFRIWALPGGKIEAGETPDMAAVREVREETGYDIGIERYLGEYYRSHTGGIAHTFVATVIGGTPDQCNDEAVAITWYPIDRLPRFIAPFHREVIADALTEQRQPFKKVQHLSMPLVVLFRLALTLRDLRDRLRGTK